MRPNLVLDMGGVLIDARASWQKIADISGVSMDHIQSKREEYLVDNDLGIISTSDAINEIMDDDGSADWYSFYVENVLPKDSVARLAEWSQLADIDILSNFNADCFYHISGRLGIDKYIRNFYISSELGVMKPNPSIYAPLVENVRMGTPVLFVDDKQENLTVPGALGVHTVLGDPADKWLVEIDKWLGLDLMY